MIEAKASSAEKLNVEAPLNPAPIELRKYQPKNAQLD